MPLFLASFNTTRGSVLSCILDVFPAVQPIMLIVFSHFYYVPSPRTKSSLLWRDQMLSSEACSPQHSSHCRMVLTWVAGLPRAASPKKTQTQKIITSENCCPETKMSAARATYLCARRGIYVITWFIAHS